MPAALVDAKVLRQQMGGAGECALRGRHRCADYLLPTVDVVPPIEIHHMESPTPLNPLGVKGAAESGTIGAPAAIVSAIEDALRPLNVRIRELPVTPARLRALIQAATHA